MVHKLPITPQKKYSKQEDQKIYKKLLKHFGNNKVLPKGYELQALRALSHYPELLNTKIHFVFKNQRIAHSSRPYIPTLFNMYDERTYVINISEEIEEHLQKTLFSNLSYNAQIGVLCHELAHTSEYIHKSTLWILILGIKYACGMFKPYKFAFENKTDLRAINHGAGYFLLQWSNTVHEHHIKDGRGQYYFSPQHIKQILSENILYS